MGASKTYKGGPSWAGKHSNRGKERPYSKGKASNQPEGTHMSGENDGLRKGAKSGAGKSGPFTGPKKRSAAASGY
jgi:hypothetical protein